MVRIFQLILQKRYNVYSDLYGTDQSLDRLADRGGFGWAEIPIFYKQHIKRFGKTKLTGNRRIL